MARIFQLNADQRGMVKGILLEDSILRDKEPSPYPLLGVRQNAKNPTDGWDVFDIDECDACTGEGE